MSDAMMAMKEEIERLEELGITGCFASLILSPYDSVDGYGEGLESEHGYSADGTINEEGLV